jgi:flagellar motor switch/type III secretory pathway protein FliN
MIAGGKLLKTGDVEAWDVESAIEPIDSNFVRFSRGLFAKDFSKVFKKLYNHWKLFFFTLGLDIKKVRSKVSFGSLPEGTINFPFAVEGQKAYFSISENSLNLITSSFISSETKDLSKNLIADYLLRRFVSSLSLSWNLADKISFNCISGRDLQGSVNDVKVLIKVKLECSEQTIDFSIGLPLAVAEILDFSLRQETEAERRASRDSLGNVRQKLSFQLGSFTVPSDKLLDYLEPGSIIQLELPVNDLGLVKSETGQILFRGKLVNVGGRWGLNIIDTSGKSRVDRKSGETIVDIEVSSLEIDFVEIGEYKQPGAIIVGDSDIAPKVSLKIGGEELATAILGTKEDLFVLEILSK